MTIMSSVAPAVALPPVFIAMACLSGTLFGATVNDSGFWIVTNMSGLEFSHTIFSNRHFSFSYIFPF